MIGSSARITGPDGLDVEADLTQVVMPLTTVPRFSREGLDALDGQDLHANQLFKQFRGTKYSGEWKFLQSLPDPGSREWKMIALAFCSQVAIETSLVYPFLEIDAHTWLKAKFTRQGLAHDFKDRWDGYKDHCSKYPWGIEHRIYLRWSTFIDFVWIGDEPRCMRSGRYRFDWNDRLLD